LAAAGESQLASGLKTDHQRSTLFSLNFCLDNGEYLRRHLRMFGQRDLDERRKPGRVWTVALSPLVNSRTHSSTVAVS
jgi:hypothetical protein